jgi:hypothetical protein
MSYGLIELTFVFAVVLALGLWELFKMRREIVRGPEGEDAAGSRPRQRRVPHED